MQRHSKSVVVTFTHFAWRWWNHYEGVIRYAKEKKLVLVAMVAWWEIANMSSQFAIMLLTGLNICTTSLHAWLVDWQTFGQEPFIEWKEEKTTVTFSFRFIDVFSCLFHECGCILSAWTFIVYRPPCLIPIMISCV